MNREVECRGQRENEGYGEGTEKQDNLKHTQAANKENPTAQEGGIKLGGCDKNMVIRKKRKVCG